MWIKRDPRDERLLAQTIAEADLDERMRGYLTRRYLEYVRWLEKGSTRNLSGYYALRIPTIVLAALVPALVALDLGDVGRTITVVLGVLVAAGTAIEEFLGSGRRWRHYRGTVELLKSEGWLFLHLAGPYAGATREVAFQDFVGRVETLVRDEVREYVTTVVAAERSTEDARDAAERARSAAD